MRRHQEMQRSVGGQEHSPEYTERFNIIEKDFNNARLGSMSDLRNKKTGREYLCTRTT